MCRSVSFLCGRVGTDAADSARECSRGAIGARQLAVLEKKKWWMNKACDLPLECRTVLHG